MRAAAHISDPIGKRAAAANPDSAVQTAVESFATGKISCDAQSVNLSHTGWPPAITGHTRAEFSRSTIVTPSREFFRSADKETLRGS